MLFDNAPASVLAFATRFWGELHSWRFAVSGNDHEKLQQDIIEVLATLIGLDPDEIKSSDRLREDLGLDSLQSMELLSRICEKYHLDVELEDVAEVATVGDVVARLGEIMREQKGP